MTISPNKFVACTYELFVGEEQELMERAPKEAPLKYIQGMNMMLPAFEKNLFGLSVGDKFDFVLPVVDAYGEVNEDAVIELPKEVFKNESGEFDSEIVAEGNMVPMRTADGQVLQGNVLEVKDDAVIMDFNHPLAGEDLHFVGEIVDVHEATAEEIQDFIGGSSCGCGCGCGDEEGSSCGCGCGDENTGSCCGGGCR
ncbi:peptidylprolyl isomerase [Porphyromonas macacae]|uniref:Peptidyl-prolyl cis-trans isomerase n=1 Tax=Porphyromonas macacae TaxID=28115 RepID=A0A0A2GDS1_9PORP|nr:FKBP-type peptidyl-prolyl cis-trans isomerase [Porphyromonas macacae]KGN76327.1 peptidylprolyl isomerase [Porphyromonas macacae]KGO00531.1 peptidylprolyl isomerase [Porphyromonas macacae]SUB89502.1 FKBP-type peptidyl-prolyl cis-trans isomerase slyD [Porphyromonas macacae]